MTNMKIKIEGLRGLEKSLRALQKEYGGKSATQAMRPAVKAAMAPLVADVAGSTPVDSGFLQGSTKLKIGKPTKKMARTVHSSSTAIIYGQVGWFFRGGHFRQALAVEYGTVDTPASFALRGAFEGNERAILNRFKNTLGPAIEKKAAAAARKRSK